MLNSKVIHKKLGITDLVNEIKDLLIEPNPTINDYLNGEAAEYFSSISEALHVICKYRESDHDFNLVKAGKDCLFLSAIHSYIAPTVGYLQGISAQSESARKMAKSKYAMEIKKLRDLKEKEGSILKITEAEVDHAIRVMSDDQYIRARDIEVISRMITSAYYSIGEFIAILNSACNRASREMNENRN